MPELSKCYSIDGENFAFSEKDDLLSDLGIDGDLWEGRIYYESDCRMLTASDIVNVDRLLEDMDEAAYDLVGSDYGSPIDKVSSEAVKELRTLIESWVECNCNLHSFWTCVGATREVVVTAADVAEYGAPEGGA